MTKEEQNKVLDNYLSKHFNSFKKKMIKMCEIKKLTYDEDVLQDTILKVLSKVREFGLKAKTPKEVENYLFRAFVLNTFQQYHQSKKSKEVGNVDVGWVIDDRDNYKMSNDVLLDYLTALVEINFSPIEVTVWKTKYLNPEEITYQRIKKLCGVKSPRRIINQINEWLRNNINNDLIKVIKEITENDSENL